MDRLYEVKGLIAEGSGEKNFEVLQAALSNAFKDGFNGLLLPEGEYEVYNEKGIYLFECLLSGKIHTLDNARWKRERNILFNIEGVEGFRVIGDSTRLNFKGLMQPFNFKDASNIEVSGISFDWIDPFYFTADVVKKQGNVSYVKPHNGFDVRDDAPIVSLNSVIKESGAQGGVALFEDISNIKKEDNGLYSFSCSQPELIFEGQSLVLRYLYSYAPVFLLYECRNILLKDINVSAAPGMGVVAQKCENMRLLRFAVTNSRGRLMSINCDATHLINCKGDIVYDNCHFEGMGDDASNVHGFYMEIKDIIGDRIYVRHDSSEQNIYPYIPVAGDDIEYVNEKTLGKLAIGKIKEVVLDGERGMYYIKLKDTLPENVTKGALIASVTEMPNLIFTNCSVKNVRGRGVLVQTRNTTVKNCIFEGCTGQGVHIDTAYGWGESIGVRNVKILDNKFINCGFGSTKYCDAVAVVAETEAELEEIGVHKDITISGNLIIGKGNAFKLSCCEDVTVEDNTIIGCNKEIPQSFCNGITIKNNFFHNVND